jgi:hypothetical protein
MAKQVRCYDVHTMHLTDYLTDYFRFVMLFVFLRVLMCSVENGTGVYSTFKPRVAPTRDTPAQISVLPASYTGTGIRDILYTACTIQYLPEPFK